MSDKSRGTMLPIFLDTGTQYQHFHDASIIFRGKHMVGVIVFHKHIWHAAAVIHVAVR